MRFDAPDGRGKAVSRMYWNKEDAIDACIQFRKRDPKQDYRVHHYTKVAYVVEEGDDVV